MLMKIVGSSCAAALLSISAVAAQGQQAPGAAGQPGQQPGHQASAQEITIVGCLQRESQYFEDARRDEPGRDLQATGNEYVLTQASVLPMTGIPGQDSAVGTTGVDRDRDQAQPGQVGQQPGQAGQPGQPGQGQAQPGQPGEPGQVGQTQPGQPGQPQPGQQAGRADRDDHGQVFSLTGDEEREFAQYVNQRVEIRGTIDHDQHGAVGTTGVTPGQTDRQQPGQQGQFGQPGQQGQAGQPGQAADQPGQAGQFPQAQDEDKIPEIEVTSIRPVAGAC